jgi:hypothetical protein
MIKKDLINNIVQTVNKIVYPSDLSKKGYLIFYSTAGYHLSEKQYHAFMEGLNKLELLDKVIHLDIEFVDNLEEIKQEEVRKISDFNYSDYKKLSLIFENCIIDEQLRWSVCVYQDYWGIIYGSNELLCEIAQDYDFKGDLEQFKKEVISEINDPETMENYRKLIHFSYIGNKNVIDTVLKS